MTTKPPDDWLHNFLGTLDRCLHEQVRLQITAALYNPVRINGERVDHRLFQLDNLLESELNHATSSPAA